MEPRIREPNLLHGVRDPHHAVGFLNHSAVLHQFAGSGITKTLVRINHFHPERRLPWIVSPHAHVTRWFACQSEDPAMDFFLTSIPFRNPLADVPGPKTAISFMGTKVFMWEYGWKPDKPSTKQFEIIKYNPGGQHGFLWWCRPLRASSNYTWYAQAAAVQAKFYITPVRIFEGGEEARTPAESLSRIFLEG